MWLKKLLYGEAYDRCEIYDIALNFFKNTNHIPYDALYRGASSELNDVFEFLESEGMCKISKHGISITERGRTMLRKGGYMRTRLSERLTRLSILVAIISGVGSLALQLFR